MYLRVQLKIEILHTKFQHKPIVFIKLRNPNAKNSRLRKIGKSVRIRGAHAHGKYSEKLSIKNPNAKNSKSASRDHVISRDPETGIFFIAGLNIY